MLATWKVVGLTPASGGLSMIRTLPHVHRTCKCFLNDALA